jgi:hypothetical protein
MLNPVNLPPCCITNGGRTNVTTRTGGSKGCAHVPEINIITSDTIAANRLIMGDMPLF